MHSTNNTRSGRRLITLMAAAASASLLLSGCVNNEETGGAGETGAAAVEVTKSEAAAALVPEDIRSAGVLKVGTDATYAPNQYADANGEVTGWEAEIVEAIAAKLDLEVEWSKLAFDQILPQVSGGSLDMGSSSFTDTVERQESVDFLDFYDAGLQFVRGIDEPELTDDLCGLTIGAQTATTADDFLTAKSDECTKAGKEPIQILKKTGQDEVTNDVVLGNTPYMLADSPIAQYGVKLKGDAIALDGEIFDAAPYGWIFAKDSEITEAVQTAAQELIDDGTYLQILENWGVEPGAYTEIKKNSVTE